MKDVKDVLQNIKRHREELSFTQEAIASELDISRRHYMDIENGKARMGVDQLLLISEFFGINPSELLNNRAQYRMSDTQFNKGGKENSYLYNDIKHVKVIFESRINDLKDEINFLRSELSKDKINNQ